MTTDLDFSAVLVLAGAFLMVVRFKLFSRRHLNAVQVMFVTHVFAQVLPAVLMSFDPSFPAANRFLLYNALAACLNPIGGISADRFFPKLSVTAFYRRPIAVGSAEKKQFRNFFLVYFAFCALIFVTFVMRVPSIPVADLLFGLEDHSALTEARRDASSQGLIYGMALRFFMPSLFILAIIGYGMFTGRSTRILLVTAAAMAVLYNAWPGSKTPVAVLFLLALITTTLRDREHKPEGRDENRSRVRRRVINLSAAILMIGYPLLIFMLKPVGSLGVWFVLQQIFQRIFYKPALNSYYAFEMFSNGLFTHFNDIKKLAQLTGNEFYNLSSEVSFYKGYDMFSNSPPAAIGNFYAQGGSFVVISGVLIAAFLFRWVENMLKISNPKTPLTITFFSITIFGAFRFSWASFHTLIMAEVFVPLLITFAIFYVTGRTRRRGRYAGVAGSPV
jgi:hypothetical protein